MSRFIEGDGENPVCYMWDANIERVCRGKRGQKLLREFVDALLALPQRRLIANALVKDGEVCALGALAVHRGVDPSAFDDNDSLELGESLGLGFVLSWQLGSENDLTCFPLKTNLKHVILDVPVTEDHLYGGRSAPLTTSGYIPDGLCGYSPEERWQHLYDWATSRIHWALPVSRTQQTLQPRGASV